MHVIVSSYDGEPTVYEATIANAKTILSWQSIPAAVTAFASNRPSRYATYEEIASVVKKILSADVGTVVFTSKFDDTQTIVATQEAKQEIVMFCFDHKIDPSSFSAYSAKTDNGYKDLQCLSYFHDVNIVEEWIADWAHKYSVIMEDKWKDDVTDLRKIRYILNFVNELSHRDSRYYLTELNPTC